MNDEVTVREACAVVVDEITGRYRITPDLCKQVKEYAPNAKDGTIKTTITRDLVRAGQVKRVSMGLYETIPENERVEPPPPEITKRGARKKINGIKPGTLRAKIVETCAEMPGKFSAGDIVEIMKRENPNVNAQTITVTVSRDLKNKGIIKRHDKGVYSYILEENRKPAPETKNRPRHTPKKQRSQGSKGQGKHEILSHEFNMVELGAAVYDYMVSMREAIDVQELEIKTLKKEHAERLERREETIRHLNTKIRQLEVKTENRVTGGDRTFKLGDMLQNRP